MITADWTTNHGCKTGNKKAPPVSAITERA